jgi:hypothetical protein
MTWKTSYRDIQEQSPEAVTLLSIVAFLSFDDIYLYLFGVNAESAVECLKDGDEEGPVWRSTLFPEQKLDLYMLEECFRVLERYSFV